LKTIILAAGIGSRLRPLTLKNHKCLLKIGKSTIIERLIDQMNKFNIRDINIVLGYKSEQIKNQLKKNYNFIKYPNYKKTNNLHTLWWARKIIKGDVIILFSDIVVEDKIIYKLIKSTSGITAVIDSSKIRKGTMYINHTRNSLKKITKLSKKEATGNFIGMLKIKSNHIKSFLSSMESNLKGTKNEYYTIVLNSMIEKKIKINVLDIKKYFWGEIDTLKDYKFIKKNEKKLFGNFKNEKNTCI